MYWVELGVQGIFPGAPGIFPGVPCYTEHGPFGICPDEPERGLGAPAIFKNARRPRSLPAPSILTPFSPLRFRSASLFQLPRSRLLSSPPSFRPFSFVLPLSLFLSVCNCLCLLCHFCVFAPLAFLSCDGLSYCLQFDRYSLATATRAHRPASFRRSLIVACVYILVPW